MKIAATLILLLATFSSHAQDLMDMNKTVPVPEEIYNSIKNKDSEPEQIKLQAVPFRPWRGQTWHICVRGQQLFVRDELFSLGL